MKEPRLLKLPFNRLLLAVAAVLVFLLMGNVFLMFRNTLRVREGAAELVQTREVITSLDTLLTLALNAETGQRGFVITGEVSYLEPYTKAVAAIRTQLNDLQARTAADSFLQSHFQQVREHLNSFMKALEEGIDMRQNSGFEAARQVVVNGPGKQEMDTLRVILAEMIQQEQSVLLERNRNASATFRFAIISGLLANLAALAAVGAFMIVLRRHLAARSATAHLIAEQRERLRTTLASIGDAVITTDTTGSIINLNVMAENLTGWKNDDAKGRRLDEVFCIVNESSRQKVENPVKRALQEGVTVGLTNHSVLIARDGAEVAIDDSAAPIRCKEGEIVGCVLVFRDVTEHRRAMRALQTSEARKSAILTSALDCIISMDHLGRIVDFNPAAERTFGCKASAVLGRTVAETIIPPEFRDAHARGLARFMTTGHGPVLGRRIELTAQRVDGTQFPCELAITTTQVAGAPPFFTAYLRDVTERIQAETALREGEHRFRLMIDALPAAVYTTDAAGRLTHFNQAAVDFAGRVPQLGSDQWCISWKLYHASGREMTLDEFPMALALKHGQVLRGVETIAERPDGTRIWFIPYPTPLHDAEGRLVGGINMLVDISRQKHAETALRAHAEELARADRSKDEFLAMLAHELRNPLAPLSNAAEILNASVGKSMGPDQAQAHKIMRRQIENMTRIIDDLLDVSRITQGKIALRCAPVALDAVLTAVTSLLSSSFAAHRQQITLSLPAEPVYLHADATRLEQVFGNLLGNACKYSGEGTNISLSAERALAADPPAVIIRVKDDGIGIPPDLLPHVFDLFVQGSRALDRTHGGLGIGLSLVQRIVRLHGGTVEAHSNGAGQGTEFVLHLPILREAPALPAEVAFVADEAPRRMLIVDDNADSALSLATLQQRHGHTTRTVFTGPDALVVAAEFLPEVVLLDIGLPEMDGFEVARRLRSMPLLAKVFIIGMSGYGRDEDRAAARLAGFDHYLIKPVDIGVLRDLLHTMT